MEKPIGTTGSSGSPEATGIPAVGSSRETGKTRRKTKPGNPEDRLERPPPVIAVTPLWLLAFLSKKEEEEELTPQRLAEITGLKFPMDRGETVMKR